MAGYRDDLQAALAREAALEKRVAPAPAPPRPFMRRERASPLLPVLLGGALVGTVFTARLLPLWWVAAGLSSGVLLALVLVFGRLQIDRGTRTVEVVLDDLPVTVQALVSVQNGDAAAARYRQAPLGTLEHSVATIVEACARHAARAAAPLDPAAEPALAASIRSAAAPQLVPLGLALDAVTARVR